METPPAAHAEQNSVFPSPLARISRALHHRNYRLFFGGQLISVIGTFLTNTAMNWLAFTLTTSPDEKERIVGIVAFMSQIPLFVLGPAAGVWVDRLDRRKLIIATQILSMLQSFGLAIPALLHIINIPEVILLALAQGLINAFDIPGRQSFVVDMVDDRQDMPNAIALNSTMVHCARVIGPAAAGLLIRFVGTGYCFLLDGFSYLAVIAALLAMRIRPMERRPKASLRTEIGEGFHYVMHFRPARVLLILMAIFSLSGIPAMMVLLPVYGSYFGPANESQGALVYGLLGASIGVGALAGALYLASRHTVVGLGRLIGYSSITYALAIGAFSLSRHLWLSMLIAPFGGWGMITNFASANTILQTLADDDKRGRVMSFFAMSFIGMTPFGALLTGEFSRQFAIHHGGPDAAIVGATYTILIDSAVCLAASIWYWTVLPEVRKIVRPIYVQRGIIREIAEGLQVTSAPSPTEP